jgi:hypothetical protein
MVDFDGDGNFDEIDVAILEEEESEKKQPAKNNNSGCCVVFLATGASITVTAWGITHYLM